MDHNHSNGNTPAGKGIPPGGAAGSHSLSDAVGDLCAQHPQKWNDLGPHHFTHDNVRHHPVSSGVYKSSKSKG